LLHEDDFGRPSGKRLEPQRPGTREEIQHPRAIEVVLETAEPAIPNILRGGPNPFGGGGQMPTRVFAGDNAHGYEA
jgi:hypothetical protein